MNTLSKSIYKLVSTLLLVQSLYIFTAALWPLIHIESFMHITGYKTDVWLVKTVALLLVAISLSGFAHLLVNGNFFPAWVLFMFTAVFLAIVDLYYVSRHVVDDVYLLDAAVEMLFILAWLYAGWKVKQMQQALKRAQYVPY